MAILPSLTRSPAAFVTDTALKAGSTASVNQSLTWRGGGAVLPTAGTAWSRKACACAAGASIEANMPTRATRKSIRLCICHLLGSEGEFGEEAVRRRGEAAGRRRAAVGLEDLHLHRSGRLGAACRHDHQIAALSVSATLDELPDRADRIDDRRPRRVRLKGLQRLERARAIRVLRESQDIRLLWLQPGHR